MAQLHLVGNAHLDPVWLWRWQEGFSEIWATFRSALDRMKDFPEFKFTSACAVYYQWIEKTDPEMFEEIRQRVREGRWNIVGGWFLQPDCNIPDGESFARHALIAQRYFRDKFGITVKTGYNVDSFGHNAALPKILQQSGIENYVFMRPGQHEKKMEDNIFYWESDDGSRVVAFRIHDCYCILEDRLHFVEEVRDMANRTGRDHLVLYGVGNHGGGPTIELIQKLMQMDIPNKVFSTPDVYFEALNKKGLKTLRDELQHHARGSYSTCSFVKAANRRSEYNLLMAERMCLLAQELTGMAYPKKKLKKAWMNLLFNQFHDILAGCAVSGAYQDAGYLYGESMSITEQAIFLSAHQICHKIDTLSGETMPAVKPANCHPWIHERLGTPVVVFNPHCHRVKMPVRTNFIPSKVTDAEGNAVAVQRVRAEYTNGAHKYQGLFLAEVDPMGYAVYRAEKRGEPEAWESQVSITEHSLENSRLRAEFDSDTGELCRLYDKAANKHLLNRSCRTVLLDDSNNDTWAHNRDIFGPEVGVFANPSFCVLEEGPVRATLQVKEICGDSTIVREYSLTEHSAELTVQVRAELREQHRVLKLAFPTDAEKITAKIPYGTITRPFLTGEEPCGSWLAAGKLCIANDGKYSYDTQPGYVRLTALRSAIYADHYGIAHRDETCTYMDMDVQTFRYALYAFESPKDAQEKADVLNFGLLGYVDTFHNGSLPMRYTGFDSQGTAVTVAAIKQHEDRAEPVIRICEMDGKAAAGSLQLFGKQIPIQVDAFGVRTFDLEGRKLNMMEWEVND